MLIWFVVLYLMVSIGIGLYAATAYHQSVLQLPLIAPTVNRVLAARIGPSERVELIVPAGELLLRVGRDPQGGGLCAMNEQWVQRETILRPGERTTFRLSLSANGQMDVMRTND